MELHPPLEMGRQKLFGQLWLYMPVSKHVGGQGQEDHKFKASLSYMVSYSIALATQRP